MLRFQGCSERWHMQVSRICSHVIKLEFNSSRDIGDREELVEGRSYATRLGKKQTWSVPIQVRAICLNYTYVRFSPVLPRVLLLASLPSAVQGCRIVCRIKGIHMKLHIGRHPPAHNCSSPYHFPAAWNLVSLHDKI